MPPDDKNIRRHDGTVTRHDREARLGQRGGVVWFTGLSGSGKSTVARAVEANLAATGRLVYVLDGDNVRHGLNKDLGFTPEDRAENVRRVAEVSRLMHDAGLVVFVALVSPFRGDRRAARDLFLPGQFLEVYVDTPLDVVSARDTKGLYAKAAQGSLPNLTGVGQEYEPPESPDLVLHGTGDLDASVDALVAAILGE